MRKRIKEFLTTKGRRLAELNAKGGNELLILGDTSKLSKQEIREYEILTVQMDAIIWALSPENMSERQLYNQEIIDFFHKLEQPYIKAQEIKGDRVIKRGQA